MLAFLQKLTRAKAAIILSTVVLLVYANTLPNNLFWDDYDSITNNLYIRSWKNFPQYFSQNLTAGSGIRDDYWRPLLLISFSLDYKIDGNNPLIYHFQNLLWHATATFLVFILVQKILDLDERRKENFRNNSPPSGFSAKKNWLALFVALFFAIHPLQTEAVSYAAGRADPMHAVFLLLSLIFLTQTRLFQKKLTYAKNKYSFSSLFHKLKDFSLFLSLLFFVLALLIKERAIILPGLAFLIWAAWGAGAKKEKLKRGALLLFPYIVIAVFYLFLRFTILHFTGTFDLGAPETIGAPDFLSKAFLMFKALAIYAGLIFWPARLYMEKTLTVPGSFFNPPVFIGLVLFVSLVWLAFHFWKKQKLVSVGIFWFFISISPSVHVFPIQGLLYEHWLYFPLIGIWLAIFVYLSKKIFTLWDNHYQVSPQWFVLVSAILIIWTTGLSARSIVRNRDWANPVTFYEKNISLGGTSARVYTNLGMAYDEAGRYDEAIGTYQKAIRLNDQLFQPWYDLGITYRQQEKIDKAIIAYQKAIEINPLFIPSYNNLAAIYLDQKNFSQAEKILQQGLEKNPQSLQLNLNLGIAYWQDKNFSEALKYLKSAQKISPNNFNITAFIAKVRASQNQD